MGSIQPLLQGIRILDLSQVMAGPYCTAMLADLGAEIIKIEMPGTGDTGRFFGPYKGKESTYFMLLNRGKKSVTVNMKSPRGVDLLKELIKTSDVLVENFRPGVTARLGLDYESVQQFNEKIVYASISGFGQEGPFRDLPALDLVIQAMSGLMSLTGQRDGPATAVGESVADVSAGIFAAWGIMAALFHRERTGQGRHLDISMLDSIFSILLTPLSRALYTDDKPTRVGNRHPETYPVDSFPTQTGDVVLVGFSDAVFRKLMDVIGQPELSSDPRFLSNSDRHSHETELRSIITQWTLSLTAEDVLSQVRQANIPCAPVWSLNQLINSDHVHSRELIGEGHHSQFGSVPLVRQPIKFSDTPQPAKQTTPMLGENTSEVLKDLLGLSDETVQNLKGQGVI